MTQVWIQPGPLKGTLHLPPSKSHTLRALLFAWQAQSTCWIENPLMSPDTRAMVKALNDLGAHITPYPKGWKVQPLQEPSSIQSCTIDCGNSGQILRFLSALVSLFSQPITFTGDTSLRTQRPMGPLFSALEQLGCRIRSSSSSPVPFTIQGPSLGETATLTGEDSQPISALLLLGAFRKKPLTVLVQNPGETPWVDLTLSWLDRFQIPYERTTHVRYRTLGNVPFPGFSYRVAGDFSSAAFPLVAALITQSEILLQGLDPKDPQGDKKLFSVLEEKGAALHYEPNGLRVRKSPLIEGGAIDVNPFIDALPILAVLGCFAKTPMHLYNAAIARKKESDRIQTITQELRKMGALIQETPDGLMIYPTLLKGSPDLFAHHDHRIAMALTVAALGAEGSSLLQGAEWVQKSYPQFFTHLQSLGASIGLIADPDRT